MLRLIICEVQSGFISKELIGQCHILVGWCVRSTPRYLRLSSVMRNLGVVEGHIKLGSTRIQGLVHNWPTGYESIEHLLTGLVENSWFLSCVEFWYVEWYFAFFEGRLLHLLESLRISYDGNWCRYYRLLCLNWSEEGRLLSLTIWVEPGFWVSLGFGINFREEILLIWWCFITWNNFLLAVLVFSLDKSYLQWVCYFLDQLSSISYFMWVEYLLIKELVSRQLVNPFSSCVKF